MTVYFKSISTPAGSVYIAADQKNIIAILFKSQWVPFKKKFTQPIIAGENKLVAKAEKQLTEYFAGKRTEFSLPYELHGTEFQSKVWSSLQKIPYGQTRSYKEQAKMIKSPLAVRAVGRTNGLNPLCPVPPGCWQ